MQQLKKSLELSKVEKEKSEQLESEKFGLNAEKQQLQRNLEAVNSRLKTFERDFDDLESQNGELQKKNRTDEALLPADGRDEKAVRGTRVGECSVGQGENCF